MNTLEPHKSRELLDEEAKDSVVSYVMDLLDPQAMEQFEKHLASGCAVCRQELTELNAVAGALSLTAPLATPPARLRDRILKIPRAPVVVRAQEGVWKPFAKGVIMKDLDFDCASKFRTSLCRLEPGATIPPHHHLGNEQCYVIEGEVLMEGQAFRAGDYMRESAGTDHCEVHTSTGCLLLLVTCSGSHMAA